METQKNQIKEDKKEKKEKERKINNEGQKKEVQHSPRLMFMCARRF